MSTPTISPNNESFGFSLKRSLLMKGIIKNESIKIAEIASSRRCLQRNMGTNWLNADVMTSVISAGFWCNILRTDYLKRVTTRTQALVQQ